MPCGGHASGTMKSVNTVDAEGMVDYLLQIPICSSLALYWWLEPTLGGQERTTALNVLYLEMASTPRYQKPPIGPNLGLIIPLNSILASNSKHQNCFYEPVP